MEIADRQETTTQLLEQDVVHYRRSAEQHQTEVAEYREIAKECYNNEERMTRELKVSHLENQLLGGEVKDEIEELKDIMDNELKKRSEIMDKAAEDRIDH